MQVFELRIEKMKGSGWSCYSTGDEQTRY